MLSSSVDGIDNRWHQLKEVVYNKDIVILNAQAIKNKIEEAKRSSGLTDNEFEMLKELKVFWGKGGW